jgi:hypothetical protein
MPGMKKKVAAKRVTAKATKPRKAVSKSSARKPKVPAKPKLLSGGNSQLAKADGRGVGAVRDSFRRGSDKKTHELLAFAGERRKNLHPTHHARDVIATIERAIRKEYGDKAIDIAFHLSDWNYDAAFIVAVHLYPERFTAKEIREGVFGVIVHAPDHLAAAGALGGYPVKDIFEVGFKVPPDED